MPNWCLNQLIVTGPKDKVAQFGEDCKSKDDGGEDSVLSFAKIVPIPKWANEQDWYSARCFLWGTKWDASEPAIENDEEYDGERELIYEFATAWSPPCEFLMRAAGKYPDLTFCLKWDEPGMDLVGRMRAAGGEVTQFRELQDRPFDPFTPWLLLGVGLDGKLKKPDIRDFYAKLDPTLTLAALEGEQQAVDNVAPALAV